MTDADMRVQPDSVASTVKVVGVNETAFGTFEMMGRERIGDTAEPKWGGLVEGRGVKDY